MKFLLVLLVVVGLGWWLSGRSARERAVKRKAEGPGAAPKLVAMIECAHCGVHLPRTEAVLDGATPYCGEAHRLAGPRPH
jgi:uncharacterized protein